MKYLSLFSGIGGFELGIQKAYESNLEQQHIGEEPEQEERPQGRKRAADQHGEVVRAADRTAPLCIGYSEVDKYAAQIYQKHFPEHKAYGDVTKINVSGLPDFDLLVGGFPCQAFSIAGKRRGFDDTRGTLFFDIARILKEKQPRNFVLENVKGLLSHDDGRTFKTIIATLAELGYGVEWQVLNAKNFGVPQNRERVFIVGHLGGIPGRKVFPIGEGGGLSAEGERERSLAGGISPAVTANYKRGVHSGGEAYIQQFNQTRIRRLTPLECERLMGYPDGWTEKGIVDDYSEGFLVKRYSEISDSQRYKCLGNGIVSNVVAEVVAKLINP